MALMEVVVGGLGMLLLLVQAILHRYPQAKEIMEALALPLQTMVLVAVAGHLPLAVMEQPQQVVTAVTVLHLPSQERLLPMRAVAVVRYINQAPQEQAVLVEVVMAL
jgi:hypothetical protein